MDASIILLTKNAGEGFSTLIQRLISQKIDGKYETIVIDSGSKDGTPEMAESLGIKTMRIPPGEFHHGRTRNLGAERAIGRILVYITQDALPLHDGWLRTLDEEFENPQVAMVVGRQIPWPTTKPPERFFYQYYFPEHRTEVARDSARHYRDNMFISNVNSAIRRDTWQTFRFAEDIAMAEDKEFARRILRDGWMIVYRPDAAVYHAHDYDLPSLFRRSFHAGIALSQGVNVPRSRNWPGRRLWYFARETGYLMGEKGGWKWLPYSAAYEISRLSGVMCGWLIGRTGIGK